VHRLAGLLRLAPLGLALGCSASPSPPRPAPGRAADKAALFGDASLVPTRHGERARQEVAWAQEIERAIAVLPSATRARVDVELPERSVDGSPRVLVVVASDAGAEADVLPSRVRAIAHAVVGPTAAVEVVTEPLPTTAPSTPPLRWPLLAGLLGLGFFAGMLLERIRRLWRAGPARRGP
jgi:hypothetical protein